MDLSSSFDWEGDPSSARRYKKSEKNSRRDLANLKITFAPRVHKFRLSKGAIPMSYQRLAEGGIPVKTPAREGAVGGV